MKCIRARFGARAAYVLAKILEIALLFLRFCLRSRSLSHPNQTRMRPPRTRQARKFSLLFIACLALIACVDTGQSRVEIPLYVAGSAIEEPLLTKGDIALTVEQAELAFGPLYLCAGYTAGDLCETARLEWLDTVVINAMNEDPMHAGELHGVSGRVYSWMYDLGISSQLTDEDPTVLDAAAKLGNASLILRGHAVLNDIRIPISASVVVQQSANTELGVPVIRKSTSDRFSHDVTGAEPALLVRFDLGRWLRELNLQSYLQDTSCDASTAAVVCAGNVELSCADDGSIASSRNCGDKGQVCLANMGCADELEITADSVAYRAVRNALLVNAHPDFSWDYKP